MDFPYSQEDFYTKNEEVWKFVNYLDIQTIFGLIERFDDRKIQADLMEVFKERLRWSTVSESACLLEVVRKRFSLENYFLEQALLSKIIGA